MVDKFSVVFLFRRAFPSTFSTAMNVYPTHLAQLGASVTVISAKRPGDKLADREVIDGVEVFRIQTNLRTARSIAPTTFALKAFKLLETLMQERSIDILHMLSFPNLGLVLIPPLSWKTPPIKVLDIRGTAVSSRWADRLSRLVLRFQRKWFRHVVVVNNHVAQALFGPTNDVEIIPIGADFTLFHPGSNLALRKQLKLQESETILIYIGNLHYPRRLDHLLQAFKFASQDVSSLRLLMVGGGSDLERLKKLARNLNLVNRVIFTGYVPFKEVPNYLRAADIGVCYVRDVIQYRDQPPIKTVEYLASGLPVVATNTPGNKDFIKHNWNGILAPDEVEAFANSITRLVQNESLRVKVAKRARKSVQEYDYQHIVRNKLIPFYKRCIKEHKGRKRET